MATPGLLSETYNNKLSRNKILRMDGEYFSEYSSGKVGRKKASGEKLSGNTTAFDNAGTRPCGPANVV